MDFLTGDNSKRSRGDDRGQWDRGSGKGQDRGGEGSKSSQQRAELEEVSQTVIIRGLPSHTTESAVSHYLKNCFTMGKRDTLLFLFSVYDLSHKYNNISKKTPTSYS